MNDRLRRVMNAGGLRQLVLLPVILLTLVIGSQLNRSFLTLDNILSNILAASAVLAVVTVAETMLIIAGKFDLSLQSVLALAPMVSAFLVVPEAAGGLGSELHPVVGLLILFAIGAAVGLFNGLLVAKLNLNAFIVTLAMLILLQGVTLGVSSGITLTSLPEVYTFIGNNGFLGVPLEVWVAVSVVVVGVLFMRFTVPGRALYAIGGNVDAARAAGIRVDRIVIGVYVAAGLLAALAGLLLTSRIASVTASQGNNLIFTVFAAAVIGGIDLNGGRGRIIGAATGVILLGIIQNMLVLSQVPSFWVSAIYGAVILLSLLLGTGTSWLGSRRARAKAVP